MEVVFLVTSVVVGSARKYHRRLVSHSYHNRQATANTYLQEHVGSHLYYTQHDADAS